MARTRNPRIERLISGAAVGVAIGVLAALATWARPELLERGEFWTYDIRARNAADPKAASKDIVILQIDEQDIEDAENNFSVNWPWPRAMFGYLATFSKRAGAKAIVYDWLFQDRGFSVTDAEEFATAMREAGNAVIGLAMTRNPQVVRATEGPWVAKLADYEKAEDATPVALQLLAWNTRSYVVPRLAGGVTLYYGGKKSSEDVVTTWQRLTSSEAEDLAPLFAAPPAEDGSEQPPPPPEPIELPEADLGREVTVESIIAARDGFDLELGDLRLSDRKGLDPPLAPIAAAPAHGGNVYQDFEADGIMRRQMPLVTHAGRVYPSLSLAAYLVGHPGTTVKLDGRTMVVGDRRVPLDEEGKVGIRFHGAYVYPHVRSFEVLRSLAMLEEKEQAIKDELIAMGKPEEEAAKEAKARAEADAVLSVPLEQLRGKYVIVSASGQALRDIRITPVSKVQEGAEVQATALDNLEAGTFIVRVRRRTDALIAFLLSVITSVGMVFLWSSIPRGGIALAAVATGTVSILVGYWVIADNLFAGGTWVAVAIPCLGAILAAFAALLVTSAAERRGRRFVQEALGRYTSRELVRELMAHPEYLSLEWGEKRPMSVYFSDIAGFTTISEGLPPERLVALLNDYLTEMTDLVLQHGGVVDKYIGDAVMAFWGAPLPDKDHARKAVMCAIAMRKRCDELRPGWVRDYGTEVRARAGVNSGGAVVGNMGSKHKYNYTVMGDMVNLASRLEGANKPYGTYLMISESTYEEVKDVVDVRELDYLAVKGKEQAVRVFEILDEKGKSPAALLACVTKFTVGLERYRKREFAAAITAFEEALRESPQDKPSLMYIERCRHFLEEPPDEGWDGVWRLEEK